MLKAIALDDEPLALKVIESFARKIEFMELQKTFTSGNEVLAYVQDNEVDLIFLDVQMPNNNGLEFVKSLPLNVQIIFSTAHSKYAVEGFNLNATDYLLKPYNFDRFGQAIAKAHNIFNTNKNNTQDRENYIYVKADYALIKVNIAHIVYIEGLDDYLKIHLNNDQKPVITRLTMKHIAEQLSDYNLVRIHRSYIVQLNIVDKVKNKMVQIGNVTLPIGKSYEEYFFKLMEPK
jgi:DNA-binding LytR/AlgR family response regulator